MLDQIKKMYEKYISLSTQATPNLADLKTALDEIRDITQSQEYKVGLQDGSIDIEWAGKLKRVEAAIKERVDEISFSEKTSSSQEGQTNQEAASNQPSPDSPASHEHDPEAQKMMDEAYDHYWKGKWKEAMVLFEKVLLIEPDWARAQEYYQKSKHNFDNRVGIPKTAIPDSVKFSFARAESALSLWELDNAKTFVGQAQAEASKQGLGQWDELNDLAFKVENYLDIHNSFEAAINLPEEKIDEAIEKIEAAYQQSQRPLYAKKLKDIKYRKAKAYLSQSIEHFKSGDVNEAILKSNEAIRQQGEGSSYREVHDEFVQFKDKQQEIRQYLEPQKLVPEQFLEIESRFKYLDSILAKYPEAIKNLPTIRELRNRMETQRHVVLSEVRTSLLRIQRHFDNASKIEDLEDAFQDEGDLIDLYAHLGADANDIKRATDRKENHHLELESIDADLKSLLEKAARKQNLSANEAEISMELLDRFSNDSNVKKLQKAVQAYESRRKLMFGGMLTIIILGVLLVSSIVFNSARKYIVSLTPTMTMTPSPTSTATMTPTLTPTFTPLPSATPLPTKMRVNRDLYAYSGCYGKTAIGEIPEGQIVTLLPFSARRFDDLNRECVLVEYSSSENAVVGWVLLLDLDSVNR